MKYFYHFLAFSLFSFLFSCNASTEEDMGFREIKITEADIISFDEVVNEIEFIPFLIPEDSPLKLSANEPHLEIDDKIYFSTGDFRDASIHVFTLNGKYEQTFKKQGEGPEEYSYLNGIDMIDDKLAIWDDQGTFKLYNKTNFDFEGVKKLAGLYIDFIPFYHSLGDRKWILVGDFDGNVDENNYYPVFYLLDEKSEEMKTLSAKARMVTSNLFEGQIDVMSDMSQILNFGASDTIYHFKNDSLRPWVKLNLADNNLPENEKLDPQDFFEKVVSTQAYNFNIGTALAANDVVRIGLFGIKKSANIVPDELSTFPIQHLYIHYPSMEFKVTKAFGAFGGKGYEKDGFFYEILYADDIQNYIESNYFGKYTTQLNEAMENLVDEEDPILLKYNVKVK